MDQHGFDRIAAALGRASSRRAGIAAALGAALGSPVAALERPRPRPRPWPRPASQCGRRNTSACRKDADCCSGRCNTDPAKTNRDGLGRCRCSRRNERCGDDKDCCSRRNQGLVCNDGVCGDPCLTLGSSCNANSTCCAGSCTRETAAGARAATCCLPLAATGCATDVHCCGEAVCIGGACANACLPLRSPCAPGDSCCAGQCGAPIGPNRGLVGSTCCLADGASGCADGPDCCNSCCNNGSCASSFGAMLC